MHFQIINKKVFQKKLVKTPKQSRAGKFQDVNTNDVPYSNLSATLVPDKSQ